MYKFEVHRQTDENGYAPIIGFVEIETPDYGDAMELAKYYAETGKFDTKRNEYCADDVAYVYVSNY